MLRSYLQITFTDRILRSFSRLGLHPGGWSLLALLLAMAGFCALWLGQLLTGLSLFVLSGFLDMVDGAVARATEQSSPLGAFLDGIFDRYVEMFLFLGLMAYIGEGKYLLFSAEIWLYLLIFGSLMTSFVRAYADHRGLVKDPSLLKRMGGLLERAERLMLIYLGMFLGLYDEGWMISVIALAAVLSNATALQRIFFAVNQSKRLG
jgi:phosphatidylglycerophosphate synthase